MLKTELLTEISVYREMLDQSAKELRITVEELEKRYESIESEGMIVWIFSLLRNSVSLHS